MVGAPPGGWFVTLVADVVPADGGKSQVTVYSHGDFTQPIRAWAEGDGKPCPFSDK